MEDGKFYHMIRKNTQEWFSPGSTCVTADRPARLRVFHGALSEKSFDCRRSAATHTVQPAAFREYFTQRNICKETRAVVADPVSSSVAFEPLTSVPFSWRIEEMRLKRKSSEHFRNHRFTVQRGKCNIKSAFGSLR